MFCCGENVILRWGMKIVPPRQSGLNYGMDVDNRIASVRLSTDTRAYMPNIWADTFELKWSDASLAGFWIQDFKFST